MAELCCAVVVRVWSRTMWLHHLMVVLY